MTVMVVSKLMECLFVCVAVQSLETSWIKATQNEVAKQRPTNFQHCRKTLEICTANSLRFAEILNWWVSPCVEDAQICALDRNVIFDLRWVKFINVVSFGSCVEYVLTFIRSRVLTKPSVDQKLVTPENVDFLPFHEDFPFPEDHAMRGLLWTMNQCMNAIRRTIQQQHREVRTGVVRHHFSNGFAFPDQLQRTLNVWLLR